VGRGSVDDLNPEEDNDDEGLYVRIFTTKNGGFKIKKEFHNHEVTIDFNPSFYPYAEYTEHCLSNSDSRFKEINTEKDWTLLINRINFLIKERIREDKIRRGYFD
jgi:hypothetical protein